jgi:dolichyl-phosphate-mannose-protein mannosyltransferase
VLCENILITESRYILCDSFLFFFSTLTIFFSSVANYYCTPLSGIWLVNLALCGISLGAAVSVKFTALGLFGSILVQQFLDLLQRANRNYRTIISDILLRFSLILIPCGILFVIFFLIHFWLLPYPGDGDAFMSAAFRARLVFPDGTKQPDYAEETPLGIIDSFFELISTMHAVNIGLKATHPYQSYWYEWPVLVGKPVLYWQKEQTWVYCMGNPVSWIVVVIAVVFFIYWTLQQAVKKFLAILKADRTGKRPNHSVWDYVFAKYWWRGLFLLTSYLGNLLPFAMIPRATWNYHYIPALLVGFMLVGIVLEMLLDYYKISKRESSEGFFRFIFVALVVFVTASFLYYAPWTYGFPLPQPKLMDRFLLKSWIV